MAVTCEGEVNGRCEQGGETSAAGGTKGFDSSGRKDLPMRPCSRKSSQAKRFFGEIITRYSCGIFFFSSAHLVIVTDLVLSVIIFGYSYVFGFLHSEVLGIFLLQFRMWLLPSTDLESTFVRCQMGSNYVQLFGQTEVVVSD